MSYVYSDMVVGLPIARCGNVRLVYDEECIAQSLQVLFATVTHERVRNSFGSDLISLLFQPISTITSDRIRKELSTKIMRWEPRLAITRLSVRPNMDSHAYDIELEYTMLGLGRAGEFRTRINVFA